MLRNDFPVPLVQFVSVGHERVFFGAAVIRATFAVIHVVYLVPEAGVDAVNDLFAVQRLQRVLHRSDAVQRRRGQRHLHDTRPRWPALHFQGVYAVLITGRARGCAQRRPPAGATIKRASHTATGAVERRSTAAVGIQGVHDTKAARVYVALESQMRRLWTAVVQWPLDATHSRTHRPPFTTRKKKTNKGRRVRAHTVSRGAND